MIHKKFPLYILVAGAGMGAVFFSGIVPVRAAVLFSQLDASGRAVDGGTVVHMGQLTGDAPPPGRVYIGEYFSFDGSGYYIPQLFQCDDPAYSVNCIYLAVGLYSLGQSEPATTVMGVDALNPAGPPLTLVSGKYYEIMWGQMHSSYAKADGNGNAFFAFGNDQGEVLRTINDAAAAKEPVIIVPGIMGSALDNASGGTEVWPDVASMFGSASDSYLDQLALGADGTQIAGKEVNASSVIESVFGQHFYKDLLDTFRQSGYTEGRNLFTVPYDWRLDIQSSTAELAAVVAHAASSSPTGRVNIVAHSMGGLLVKEYLSTIAGSSTVDKLVLAGVPQLGAPEAFRIVNYGSNMGFQFPLIGTNILNAEEIKKIVQNMPAAYQLLPSSRYVQIAGGYVQDFRSGASAVLNHDQTDLLMKTDPAYGRNSALLGLANSFHTALDTQAVNAPDVYNLVGCLDPTISGYNLYDNGVVDISRSTGDGTVPSVSAMNLANGFKNYFVLGNETGIDHTGLIRDSRPLALIKNIVEGTDGGSGALPDGISTSAADCITPRSQFQGETTLEFSSHSPAALGIYDAQNRYTGPHADGTVEVGIPGSQYGTIGDNSFVLVPAGSAYKVVAQGTGTGTLELKAKGYVGGTVDRSVSYLSVPVRGTGTKAELDFSNWSGNLSLQLDEDGNGSFETSTQPGAAVVGTSTADILPPAIIILSSTTSVPVRVNATDMGSGIALLQTYIDGSLGVATSTGAAASTSVAVDVSSLAAGDHTLSVLAYDEAGNPRNASTTFRISAPTSTPVTVTSTIGDIQKCFRLGWFGKQSAENDLLVKAKAIVKIEKRMIRVRRRLANGKTVIQNVQKAVSVIDRGAAKSLLNDLAALHNKGGIKDAGYAILKTDVEWLAR